MSWNGSINCGYCYGKGHNRRTCPALRSNMEKRAEADPNDIYAKYYFDKQRASKKKRCSYCEGVGHTRPTCKELKHAKKVALDKCKQWRKELVEQLRDMGYGLGALVEYEKWGDKRIGVITEVKWNNLTFLHQHGRGEYAFVLQSVCGDSPSRNEYWQLPRIKNVYEPDYLRSLELLSPISAESFNKQIPRDFLLSEDCIEFIFQEDASSKNKTMWHSVVDWCPKKGFYGE